MSVFAMCDACPAEYENPEDQHFHAEPTACPVCGPHLWLEEPGREPLTAGALEAAAGPVRTSKSFPSRRSTTWERLLKQDVKYRFVIDMASLKSENQPVL